MAGMTVSLQACVLAADGAEIHVKFLVKFHRTTKGQLYVLKFDVGYVQVTMVSVTFF